MKILFILISVVIVILFSCSENPTENKKVEEDQISEPRWITDIPLTYPSVSDFLHDNRIYETEHFLVYSDAASDYTKIQFAQMGEQAYSELKSLFNIAEKDNFTIQKEDPNTKIQIICNKNDPRSQRSFLYGFMLYTLDSSYCFANEENLYREVKHELTHVFQMYLDGSSRRYLFGWFREGLAEYCADGGFFPQITTLEYFNELKLLLNTYGIHPLKMRWSELRNKPGNVHSAAYSMSGLAMRYLLDTDGLGKSIENIKQIFEVLKFDETIAFETAFENAIGFNIHNFENNFYSYMPGYLISN